MHLGLRNTFWVLALVVIWFRRWIFLTHHLYCFFRATWYFIIRNCFWCRNCLVWFLHILCCSVNTCVSESRIGTDVGVSSWVFLSNRVIIFFECSILIVVFRKINFYIFIWPFAVLLVSMIIKIPLVYYYDRGVHAIEWEKCLLICIV